MGGGGGKGKSETFIDVQIQDIYPDSGKPNHFQKHLLSSYMMANGDNYGTIVNLINGKNNMSNMKVLEKFGFKVVDGYTNKITEYSLISYLLYKGYKDINILYDLRIQYLLNGYGSRDQDSDSGNCIGSADLCNYYLDLPPCCNKWSFNKREEIYINDSNYNGNNDYSILYIWDNHTTRMSKIDIKYKKVDDVSLNIIKRLEYDPNITLTSDNYTYTYKDFHTYYENNITQDSVSYTYHKYKYNGKTYNLVWKNNVIKNNYLSDEDTYEIYLNEDGTSNYIWYTMPKNNTSFIVFGFTANRSKKHRYIVDKLDTLLQINAEYNSFLWIDVKHNGHMVSYDNAHKAVQKKIGLQLPSNISNSDIKDVSFTVSSNLQTNYEILNDTLVELYGTDDNPNNVTIETPNGKLEYYSIYYPKDRLEQSYIGREISYKEYKIKTRDKVFLTPLGPLKQMKLKDFYISYFGNLTSWSYMKKTIKLKWYQTMFFQFALVAVTAIFCPMCAAIMVGTMVVEQTILNPVLKSLGFSKDEITVIDIAIDIYIGNVYGTSSSTSSAATTQTASVSAESTASSSTTVTTTASTTSTTIGTSTVSFATDGSATVSNSAIQSVNEYNQTIINQALEDTSKSFSDYVTEASDWIQNEVNSMITDFNNASTLQKISYGLKALNTGVKMYYGKQLKKDKNKQIQLQNQIDEMGKKIKSEFNKHFMYRPFDMLDAYDSIRTMDPFDLQDQLDSERFNPLPNIDYYD